MQTVTIVAPPELPGLLARLAASDRALAAGKAVRTWAPALNRKLIEGTYDAGSGGGFARGWLVGAVAEPPTLLVRNTFGKARFVEYPTRAHIIRAKKGKALAWKSVGFGKMNSKGMFFFKKVHHPGFRGYGIFRMIMEAYSRDFFVLLSAELKSFVKGK